MARKFRKTKLRKQYHVTRYRPVPRTLSDIMRRLARRSSNAPELMSPESLRAQRAPIVEPGHLFKGVTIRPSLEERTREQVAQQGMKTPENLFGDQRMALPGAPLVSPQELDLLPGQPLPEMILQPLPEPAEQQAAGAPAQAEAGRASDLSHSDSSHEVL